MTAHRKLNFESLESRRVCAGNVHAAVVDGVLHITGDAASNYIDVQKVNVDGTVKFVVTGRKFDGSFDATGNPVIGDTLTKINTGNKPFVRAAEALDIHLNGGNDAVTVGGKRLSVNVKGLTINTGLGRDYIAVRGTHVTSLQQATIQTTQASGFTTEGQREAGDEKVVIDRLTVDNNLLVIATGGGRDRLAVTRLNNTQSSVYIYSGGGVDTLALGTVDVFRLNVDMGASVDRDSVSMKSVTDSELTVLLGAGAGDVLGMGDVHTTSKTTLDGGEGIKDTLKVGTNVSLADKTVTGFEIKPAGF